MSSREKIAAYSLPITPPPTTVNERGSSSIVNIWSLSSTRFPSKGIPSGWVGVEPTAMRMLSPRTFRSPSMLIVFGSTKHALPRTMVIPRDSSRRSCHLTSDAMTLSQRSRSSCIGIRGRCRSPSP
jgi:hypothetical protein